MATGFSSQAFGSGFSSEAGGSMNIPDATLKGYFAEGARTNLCLQSQAFATTWTQTNVTTTSDSIAAPDGTVTADTLTAGAANGTKVQTVTAASTAYTWSLYLKRKTGTGDIAMSLDGGSTYTVKAITAAWTRVSITQTVLNPSMVLKIVTSGDEVYAWGSQLEAATFASSYIPTTTAAVTQNADNLNYSPASNFVSTIGSAYIVVRKLSDLHPISILIISGDGQPIRIDGSTAYCFDGTLNTVPIGGISETADSKLISRWDSGTSEMKFGKDGTLSAVETFDGLMGNGSTFSVGPAGNNSYFAVRNLKIWPVALPDATLIALTT